MKYKKHHKLYYSSVRMITQGLESGQKKRCDHIMSTNNQSQRAKNINRRNIPSVEHMYDISRTTSSYVTALKYADAKQFTCEHSTEYDSSEFQNLILPFTSEAISPEIV